MAPEYVLASTHPHQSAATPNVRKRRISVKISAAFSLRSFANNSNPEFL